MVAGNPCYTTFPPSLPERTTSAATLYIKPRTGVVPPILPPEPGEQVRITVGSCYGPESPLPQVGGNILYPRARQGVVTPTEPPTPGAEGWPDDAPLSSGGGHHRLGDPCRTLQGV